MPRTRKTQSGERAQNIQSVAGQRYGEGVASAELQRQMPTPDLARAVRPVATSAPVQGGAAPAPAAPAAPPPSPQEQWLAQLEAAKATPGGPGLLAMASQRPNEPVTAGLPVGPGAGPGALRPLSMTPAGRFYRDLAQKSGDPYWERLAQRIGL